MKNNQRLHSTRFSSGHLMSRGAETRSPQIVISTYRHEPSGVPVKVLQGPQDTARRAWPARTSVRCAGSNDEF